MQASNMKKMKYLHFYYFTNYVKLGGKYHFFKCFLGGKFSTLEV